MSAREKCHHRCDVIASDKVDGQFNIPCDEEVTIWNGAGVSSAGTVTIYYSEGCADELLVQVIDTRGKVDAFTIPRKNTRSRTYANISKVIVTCREGNGMLSCYGHYCLNLHYFIAERSHPMNRRKQHTLQFRTENIR